MTLCIAAACQDRGRSRVVIGTDWKVSTGDATAEIQDKLYWINDNIPVMIAGTVSRAIELKDTYRNYFASITEQQPPIKIRQSNMTDELKKPLAIYKEKLAEEYVTGRFGMDYAAFKKAVGKKQIPKSVAIEAYGQIALLDLECELLIITFDEDKNAHIYKTDADAVLHQCEQFAAIGSGSPIAESVLCQREHESDHPLGPTVYQVFEATQLGSIASDVGREHTIDIIYPPDRDHKEVWGEIINEKGTKFLNRQFGRLGPKEFSRLALPKGILTNDF